MTTTDTGRAAESLAADYLEAHGYAILERNWRNRWCELDIVARNGNQIHFVEVKYRRNTSYGFAAEYINRDKIQRLRRAALAWTQAHGYGGGYQVDILSVEGALDAPTISLISDAIS